MYIPKTNSLFTQADAMNAICEPLFAGTDIGFFDYIRYYPHNTMMKLSTYPEWSSAVIEKKLASDRNRIIDIMKANKTNFLHDTFYFLLQEINPEANALGKHYNIDSDIGFVNRCLCL